jgi:DNA topoisomerase VI subunit B
VGVVKTERIVQFGITIDAEQIKKTIEKNAIQQVGATLKNNIIKEMTGKHNYTKFEYSTKMWNAINEQIKMFLDENKEEIINIASDKLADRLVKTKKVKDMVTSTINNLLE